MNSYQDFIRGRFEGLSLTRDGRMTVAPKMDTLFSSDQLSCGPWRGAAMVQVYTATRPQRQVSPCVDHPANRLAGRQSSRSLSCLCLPAHSTRVHRRRQRQHRIGQQSWRILRRRNCAITVRSSSDGWTSIRDRRSGEDFPCDRAGKRRRRSAYETACMRTWRSKAEEAAHPAASRMESSIASRRKSFRSMG